MSNWKAYDEVHFSNEYILRWVREGDEYVSRITCDMMDDLQSIVRQQADRIAELEECINACYAVQKMQAEEVYKGNDRIAELEKECAWAKDQWNKDRICFESRRNELEKDLALKTRDRDVFRDFTLAYEKRIEEMEKVIQDGIKVFGEIQNQRLKDKFETPQTKPLSDEEIVEIADNLKESSQPYNINFARAIEERHGIK